MTEEKGVQQRLDDRFLGAQTLEGLASQRELHFADCVLFQRGDWSGEQKIYFKKRKRVISKEAMGHSSGHFKRHFGPQCH